MCVALDLSCPTEINLHIDLLAGRISRVREVQIAHPYGQQGDNLTINEAGRLRQKECGISPDPTEIVRSWTNEPDFREIGELRNR
jgi:hypothetical protein